MKEKIIEIIVYIAPLIAGFITSIIIPLVTKSITVKYLKRKIDDVNEAEQFKDIKKELASIKREILEMRGKLK